MLTIVLKRRQLCTLFLYCYSGFQQGIVETSAALNNCLFGALLGKEKNLGRAKLSLENEFHRYETVLFSRFCLEPFLTLAHADSESVA